MPQTGTVYIHPVLQTSPVRYSPGKDIFLLGK